MIEALIMAGTVAAALGFGITAARKSFGRFGKPSRRSDLPNLAEEHYRKERTSGKGFFKQTNVLHVFPSGLIRTRDGGYIRGYTFAGHESLYAAPDEVSRLYQKWAMLLTDALPKNAVVQFRFDNSKDAGRLLNEQIFELTGSEANQTAVMLKNEEINYYFDLAEAGNFRQGSFQVWVYLPGERKGQAKNGVAGFVETFGKRGKWRDIIGSNEKTIIGRTEEEERRAVEAAERRLRSFEQNFPAEAKPMSFSETAVRLRLSHNPGAVGIPTPPALSASDWGSYLNRTAVKHDNGDWFLWHGRTPVTVITLFEPPESSAENPTCYPGLMRFLTVNPTLRGSCTVVTEYVAQDKNDTVLSLKKELKRMRETNTRPSGNVEFRDEKVKRIYQEKKQLLEELTSPGKALTQMRFHIVVKGAEVNHKEDRRNALQELQNRANDIIKLIHEHMRGAQADFEDPPALRTIYENILIGEICPKSRHREIKEQALSLACFIPAEQDWQGIKEKPHNIFVNTSGELIGVNLLRNPYAATPLTLILGSSGSGKSVLAAEMISGFLGSTENARVRACDYGGSLAPLVNLFNGRYFRFSEKDRRTINIWDYDGLEKGEPPNEEQTELVVKDTLILLGADERSDRGKDFAAVLEKCVRQVYADEVPRNAPGRRHEPRLSHLIRKLRTFPFESADERGNAARMAGRLETYEGNPWVDAATDPSYRQNSTFDVFELSSLDKLPDALRSCLAFRIGARVGTGDDEIEGFHPPTLVVYDEVHEYVRNEYLAFTLRGAERTVRHGRKKNKVPILITHSFDDIKDFPGFTSNIGSLFVGKQDDISSLKTLRRWNERIENSIYNIDNRKGAAHQFLYATGQGDNQKTTMIQVYLSPISLWTFTTDPPEDEARKILTHALPHWSWTQILITLARQYPRGLSFAKKNKLDAEWLEALLENERKLNPQLRRYHRQLNESGVKPSELPEELNLEDFADEAVEVVVNEIERLKKAGFGDLEETNLVTEFPEIDIPGAIIAKVQGVTK